MKLQCSVFSALAIVLLLGSAASQAIAPDSSGASRAPIVNIPFFAENGHGNQRASITASDFSIIDNGRPLQSVVALRTAQEVPLRLGILIDTSSSEGASRLYRPGLAAISELVPRLLTGHDDKLFVVNFDSTPKATAFMDREEFLHFRTNARPGGATAFFDAVYLASKDRMQVDPTQPARRVLVILTDGGDNLSHVDHNKAIDAAQRAGTVIFAVSTSEQGADLDNARLRKFGEATGGQVFDHLTPGEIPKIFKIIQDQIDNMYVVSFVPQEFGKQGERHTIELKAVSDKKLKLRAPKAYYPSPSMP